MNGFNCLIHVKLKPCLRKIDSAFEHALKISEKSGETKSPAAPGCIVVKNVPARYNHKLRNCHDFFYQIFESEYECITSAS